MAAPITVRIDERLRLAGILLAAGDWPEREQTAKPYKPHRVAEQAHKHFAAFREHAAVRAVDDLVSAGDGVRTLYQCALTGHWLGPLDAEVAAFQAAAQPESFWAETQADWLQAETDAREVLARADLAQFLTDMFGSIAPTLVFAPNLLFPGQQSVAAQSESEIVVCQPPPKAWGTSPPWRYTERPDEVMAALSEAFARCLFELNLPAEHSALQPKAGVFALASAVLFLRQAEGEAAGDQFMIMEKRTRNLPNLPAVVNALEPILADRRAGKYTGLAEYVSSLSEQL